MGKEIRTETGAASIAISRPEISHRNDLPRRRLPERAGDVLATLGTVRRNLLAAVRKTPPPVDARATTTGISLPTRPDTSFDPNNLPNKSNALNNALHAGTAIGLGLTLLAFSGLVAAPPTLAIVGTALVVGVAAYGITKGYEFAKKKLSGRK